MYIGDSYTYKAVKTAKIVQKDMFGVLLKKTAWKKKKKKKGRKKERKKGKDQTPEEQIY